MDSLGQESKIIPYRGNVTRQKRECLNSHKSVMIWFTGLSGAGKSSIAHLVEDKLYQIGCRTFVFDGDNVRQGLCSDLGFSDKDRSENIRRIGEMSKLFLEAGIITLTAFISPFKADRERIRKLVSTENFIEILCKCSLETCEQRDTKGLYKLARKGIIKNFTGISSIYEPPDHPDLILDTEKLSLEECGLVTLNLLIQKKIVPIPIKF